MWFLIIALVSIVASLLFGRLLARASAERTNPVPVRGPSREPTYPAHRDAVAEDAARKRMFGAEVHLN
jgi:hypothetical protein